MNNNTIDFPDVMEEDHVFFNDFDVLSELNLPPSDNELGSALAPNLYCDEVLDYDRIMSFSDATTIDGVNLEMNIAFYRLDPESSSTPQKIYKSLEIDYGLDRLPPWTGPHWREKNDHCVDLGCFAQDYLESLWLQFFGSLNVDFCKFNYHGFEPHGINMNRNCCKNRLKSKDRRSRYNPETKRMCFSLSTIASQKLLLENWRE